MTRRGPSKSSEDRRITIYTHERAIPGRVLQFVATGALAVTEIDLPPEGRHPFTLHIPGSVISGELICLAGDRTGCRLQFAALSDEDRRALEPLITADD